MSEEQNGELIGYARVSTEDQSLDLQLDALRAEGIPDDAIYCDKQSGASMDRPNLKLAMKVARAGDTIVVWKLDRLGRSVRGVLDAFDNLKERGINLKILTMGIDSGTPEGRLAMTLMLAVAELERSQIAERTKAGIAAFKARGGRMGQKHRILDYPKRLARFKALWASGAIDEMTGREIVAEMNRVDPDAPPISGPSTYFNWKRGNPEKGIPPFKGFELPSDTPLRDVAAE